MPIVNIKIVEGRSVEQKRALAKNVTRAVAESIGVPESAIWISIEDLKAENLAQGGELRLDRQGRARWRRVWSAWNRAWRIRRICWRS